MPRVPVSSVLPRYEGDFLDVVRILARNPQVLSNKESRTFPDLSSFAVCIGKMTQEEFQILLGLLDSVNDCHHLDSHLKAYLRECILEGLIQLVDLRLILRVSDFLRK